MDFSPIIKAFVATLLYSLLGLVIFAASFVVMNFLSPFSLRKEIEEDQNIALAILMASVILGLSIIIAAAVSG